MRDQGDALMAPKHVAPAHDKEQRIEIWKKKITYRVQNSQIHPMMA